MPHGWRRLLFALGAAAVFFLIAWSLISDRERRPNSTPGQGGKGLPAERIEEFLLEPGPGTERELAKGAVHAYSIDLEAGQFLHLIVEQPEADVEIRLLGPDGSSLFEVDNATLLGEPDEVFIVAETAGRYRAKVSAYVEASGRYRVRIAAVHPASDADRRQASAHRAFHLARTSKSDQGFLEAIRLGDPALKAEAQRRLGNLYLDRWRADRAIEPLQQSLAFQREAGDLWREAALHNDLGDALKQLEERVQAEDHFRRALDLARQIENEEIEAIALTNIALLMSQRGERLNALSLFEQARMLWGGLRNVRGKARNLMGSAIVYGDLGETEAALAHFEQALELLRGTELQADRAIALTELSNVLANQGRLNKASEKLAEALRLWQSLGDRKGEATVRNSLGFVHYRRGEFREAIQSYRQASSIFEERRDLRGRVATWINLAWAHGALNEWNTAVGLFDRALSVARETENVPAEAAALQGLAWIERRRGNLTASRQLIERSLERMETLRGASGGRDLRDKSLSQQQDGYSFLITLLMQMHRRHPSAGYNVEALGASERARTRGLLEDLGDPGLQTAGRVRKERLVQTLSALEIQQFALAGDELLLEYRLEDEKSFLWAVDRERIQSFELPPRKEIEARANRVLDLLKANGRGANNERSLLEASENLSRVLLGPVAASLGARPLRIAADSRLHYIPFAFLADPAAASVPLGGGRLGPPPLVVGHEITMVPSGSVLAVLRREAEAAPPSSRLSLAAVGDAVFGVRDERLRGLIPLTGEPSLFDRFGSLGRRLLKSKEELDRILALLPPERVLRAEGFEANRGLVVGGGLEPFDILHFALHGLANPKDGGESALFFSSFDSRGRPIDSVLKARDIYDLDLNAVLVVLSACETGLGEEVRGEGLVGLPQSFFAAGAKNVVVSLWSVKDYSAAELMPRFYQALLKRGLSPAAALREAQVSMWRDPDWRRPHLWAGFVVQGTGTEAPLRSSHGRAMPF